MTRAMFHRRRAERFAQLLDEANGGRRRHSRSPLDGDLSQLVALGHRTAALRPTVDTGIDPGFKTGLRAMLVATAERDGIGVTAAHAEHQPASQATSKAASTGALAAFGHKPGLRGAEGGLSPRGRRLRARGAVLAAVALGAIAVSGISTASEDAKPGDALYGVKRSSERAQLALASSDVNRGQLYLDFARTRLAEATAMNTPGTDLPTVLTDMDADTRQGVKLLTTAAASRRDESALRAVDMFLTGQQAGVSKLVSRLDGAERQQAVQSRTLLADVKVRVDALRRTLACGASSDASTDSLGPLPRSCGGLRPVDGSKRSSRQSTGRGPQSATNGAPEKATGSAPPAQPEAGAGGGSASAAPTPLVDQTQAPTEGLFDQVGRTLGDLLGG